MDLKSLNPLWRDKKFWAAITTALLFWVILFWIAPPRSLFLSWPLYAPGKFLMLALVYPVLEELVFRGLVQGTIYNTQVGKKQFAKLSIANISASLFFAKNGRVLMTASSMLFCIPKSFCLILIL